MKAIVSVIDDDGRVIEKDKLILPYKEYIDTPKKNGIPTKTTYFRFGISQVLYNGLIDWEVKTIGDKTIPEENQA